MQIDQENGQIANFFWADGQSIMDYACFGDAVSFDTNFQTNKFEMHLLWSSEVIITTTQ